MNLIAVQRRIGGSRVETRNVQQILALSPSNCASVASSCSSPSRYLRGATMALVRCSPARSYTPASLRKKVIDVRKAYSNMDACSRSNPDSGGSATTDLCLRPVDDLDGTTARIHLASTRRAAVPSGPGTWMCLPPKVASFERKYTLRFEAAARVAGARVAGSPVRRLRLPGTWMCPPPKVASFERKSHFSFEAAARVAGARVAVLIWSG